MNKEEKEPSETVEAPLTLAGAANVAASLHGSLMLDEILRQCRRMLEEHFTLGRLSLVQHRANETAVTVYSIDSDINAPIIGPKVMAVEPSRLSQCISGQQEISTCLPDASAKDDPERNYLLLEGDHAVMYFPLVLKDKLKGVLVLGFPQSSLPGAAQAALVAYVARHLSIAIENSDILYFERRRGRQLTLVSEIAKKAVMLEDLGEFLRQAALLLRKGFDYHVVQIWTKESKQETLRLQGYAHKAQMDLPAADAIPAMVEECRRQNKVFCNNNLAAGIDEGSAADSIASRLVVPIRLRGKFLGVLSLESSRLDAFPPEDLNIMEGVASLIASAFDNLQAFAHAQQSNEYMQAILKSAKDVAVLTADIHGYVITSSAGSPALFRIIQQELLGRDILTLFTDANFQRELALFISRRENTLEKHRVVQRTGDENTHFDVTVQRVDDADTRPIGFLCIVRDVSETVRLQQSLEALSITDELTGLFNQRHFFTSLQAEVERCRRFKRSFSLAFFDLDGFKQFNDYFGHLRGDQALKDTADLIRSVLRSNVDNCYRYGGDEFTIVMPETTKQLAQTVCARIRTKLNEHFQGDITASIGVAECSGSITAEELLVQADRAMYLAKSQGGNRVVIAEEERRPK